jgi:cytochrome c biogenesis protein CcmG/thiol:disulfide interchange protein DsbE
MKKHLTFSNLLTAAIIAAVLYLQAPTWFANSDVENLNLLGAKVINLQNDKELLVEKDKKYIFLFWATWCAPCKVDMDRYKASVEAGKIPKENIWAINPFENTVIVKKFMKKEPYPFTFVDDSRFIINKLNIKATPTVTFVEKGLVTRQSSGISILGIYKAEWLFD